MNANITSIIVTGSTANSESVVRCVVSGTISIVWPAWLWGPSGLPDDANGDAFDLLLRTDGAGAVESADAIQRATV